MIKKIGLVLLGILYIGQSAFSQVNGPFVSERFEVYNGILNFKVWGLGDFFVMNSESFNLSVHDLNYIQEHNYKQFEANYLLQEENHWVQRLNRTLLFQSHPFNKNLNSFKTPSGTKDLGSYLIENIGNPNLRFYKSSSFMESFEDPSPLATQLSQLIGFRFIQDYAYNRVSQKLEIYIAGIAPIVLKDGKVVELCWLRFGNLKNNLGRLDVKTNLISALEESRFHASVDESINSIMKGVIDHSYQTDLNALVSLKLLEEKLSLSPDIYAKAGKFKVNVQHQEIRGEIRNNVLNGLVTVKNGDNEVVLTVSFIDGKPDGVFQEFYSEGKIKVNGQFTDGVREGEWTCFFQNGNKLSVRNYDNGFLAGSQNVFYNSGQLRITYAFEEGRLSGNYVSYHQDGIVKESGQIANGLLVGEWSYHLKIDAKYCEWVLQNEEFFNKNFQLLKGVNAQSFADGFLTFKVVYSQSPGDNCLNHLCPKIEMVSKVK